jgi:hypothetical protein
MSSGRRINNSRSQNEIFPSETFSTTETAWNIPVLEANTELPGKKPRSKLYAE